MHRQTSIPFLLVAALLAAPVSSALGGPPADQKSQAVRYHRYVYYPSHQIYYATEQQIWFWQNNGGWSYGVDLPPQFREAMGTGLPLRLATDRPYMAHDEVEARFGQPWRERHRPVRSEGDPLHDASGSS